LSFGVEQFYQKFVHKAGAIAFCGHRSAIAFSLVINHPFIDAKKQTPAKIICILPENWESM
jgi:prophage maintenance system killer protein